MNAKLVPLIQDLLDDALPERRGGLDVRLPAEPLSLREMWSDERVEFDPGPRKPVRSIRPFAPEHKLRLVQVIPPVNRTALASQKLPSVSAAVPMLQPRLVLAVPLPGWMNWTKQIRSFIDATSRAEHRQRPRPRRTWD